jgi:ATP-binding cassette subfamily F protein uup
VLLVSHDRAFLDNVVTDTIAPEGDGRWTRNPGGYTDWKRLIDERAARASRQSAEGAKPAPSRERPVSQRPRKLGFNQARELEAMPARMQALETEQAQIGARLADPALYSGAPDEIRQMQKRYAAIEEELTTCLKRWEDLEALRDQAGA